MGNRRKSKVLTGAIIALGIVLCLLVGTALFLEYKKEDNHSTVPNSNTSELPQEDVSSNMPVVNHPVTEDTPEGSGEKQEQEEPSASQSDPKNEDIIEGNDEQKESESSESTPSVEKPVESKPVETQPQESEPVESKPVESSPSGEEGETSSRPTESGPAETVPIDTSNMTDEF